jgi:hypothetical protein
MQHSSGSLKIHKHFFFISIHSENRGVRRRNGQIQECVLQFGGAKKNLLSHISFRHNYESSALYLM